MKFNDFVKALCLLCLTDVFDLESLVNALFTCCDIRALYVKYLELIYALPVKVQKGIHEFCKAVHAQIETMKQEGTGAFQSENLRAVPELWVVIIDLIKQSCFSSQDIKLIVTRKLNKGRRRHFSFQEVSKCLTRVEKYHTIWEHRDSDRVKPYPGYDNRYKLYKTTAGIWTYSENPLPITEKVQLLINMKREFESLASIKEYNSAAKKLVSKLDKLIEQVRKEQQQQQSEEEA